MVAYFIKNQKPRIEPIPVPILEDKGATSTGIDLVVKANNEFALDFYSELKNEKGNILFLGRVANPLE